MATFATDELFSDPGQPWDGQPTKVAPSGGIEATGFVPGQPVPVEFLNYLLNEYSAENQDRRLEKALNYPSLVTKALAGLGTVTPHIARATWGQRHLYFVSNGTIISVSYDEGKTWATDDTLASAVYSGIATYEGPNGDESTSAACATMTLSGAGRVSMRGETATWNDQGLTGAASALNVVADQDNGFFWVVGQRTAGTAPGIWGVETNDGATGGSIITVHPTSGSYALETVAFGGGFGLAARTGGTGLWTWTAASSAAAAVTPPGFGDVRDIVWSDYHGFFFLCQEQGGQGSIWRSATGQTGTWTSVGPGDGTETRTWALNGGCAIGRLVVLTCTTTVLGVTFLLVSDDAGTTWHRVADPTTSGHSLYRVRRCGNGIVACGSTGAVTASFAIGQRGGAPL